MRMIEERKLERKKSSRERERRDKRRERGKLRQNNLHRISERKEMSVKIKDKEKRIEK